MKSSIVKFVVFIIIASLTACNFSAAADDIPRIADDIPRVADDIPRVADDIPRVADDIPRVADDIPRVADDAARAAFFEEISLVIQNEVDVLMVEISNVLSPEDQKELQRVMKSATCLILEADIEGRRLTERDIHDFVVKQIIGISLIPYQQEIANKAIKAYKRITLIASERNFDSLIFIGGVTLYCGV